MISPSKIKINLINSPPFFIVIILTIPLYYDTENIICFFDDERIIDRA